MWFVAEERAVERRNWGKKERRKVMRWGSIRVFFSDSKQERFLPHSWLACNEGTALMRFLHSLLWFYKLGKKSIVRSLQFLSLYAMSHGYMTCENIVSIPFPIVDVHFSTIFTFILEVFNFLVNHWYYLSWMVDHVFDDKLVGQGLILSCFGVEIYHIYCVSLFSWSYYRELCYYYFSVLALFKVYSAKVDWEFQLN